MKNRERIAWLTAFVFGTTIFGLIMVCNGWWNGWCEVIAWFLAFPILWWLSGGFVRGIGAILIISAVEDALFLIVHKSVMGQPIYPMYSHAWLADLPLIGWLTQWFGLDWLGLPSGYFFAIGSGVAILFVNRYGQGIKFHINKILEGYIRYEYGS